MKQIILKTQLQSETNIFIGENIQQNINTFLVKLNPTKIVYITSENLENKLKKYLNVNNDEIIVLKDGEKEKNINNIINIAQALLSKNIDRQSLVIAYGGGMLSDISGFAASIFYRGIPVIFIPTTLLAQIDASIGGKNTVNFNQIKNVLGTFYQPRAIFIDTANLDGLPQREFASGMSEIIKYGIGFDKNILEILTDNDIDNKLIEIITRSVKIKKEIVEEDQIETKEVRKLLNLGHTLGHALESKTEFKLSHGEGVAIGLHFACFVAHRLGNIASEELQHVIDILTKYKLPIYVKFDTGEITNKISYDKKKSGENIDFVTIKKLGEAYICKISLKEIKKYLDQFNNKIGDRLEKNPKINQFTNYKHQTIIKF